MVIERLFISTLKKKINKANFEIISINFIFILELTINNL